MFAISTNYPKDIKKYNYELINEFKLLKKFFFEDTRIIKSYPNCSILYRKSGIEDDDQ